MTAKLPPMGWNTWNTFGSNISEDLIRETIDAICTTGLREAGYEYVIIDDAWAQRERNAQGEMAVDPIKFPNGMKALSDYAHEKGVKLGIYSCAGVRTCCKYPGSFDHEYTDARTFARWGVDYLKYDFCNFPLSGDVVQRYLTMSMALRSSGRDILFAACNWGRKEPKDWMRSIGAHTYRSDTDIRDSYQSMADIMRNQVLRLNGNAPGCFNDLDMLTVGMDGKGHVSSPIGGQNGPKEYEMQFAFWCMTASPLIMGCDVRTISQEAQKILTHPGLIAINQDPLVLPPYPVLGKRYEESILEDTYILLKILAGGEFAIGMFNLNDTPRTMECLLADCGIPYGAEHSVKLQDVMSGEDMGMFTDDIVAHVDAHHCKIFRGRVVRK